MGPRERGRGEGKPSPLGGSRYVRPKGRRIFCGFGVPLGSHFGVILVTFSSFVVTKWEVRLLTSFFMLFGVGKRPECSGFMWLTHSK